MAPRRALPNNPVLEGRLWMLSGQILHPKLALTCPFGAQNRKGALLAFVGLSGIRGLSGCSGGSQAVWPALGGFGWFSVCLGDCLHVQEAPSAFVEHSGRSQDLSGRLGSSLGVRGALWASGGLSGRWGISIPPTCVLTSTIFRNTFSLASCVGEVSVGYVTRISILKYRFRASGANIICFTKDLVVGPTGS